MSRWLLVVVLVGVAMCSGSCASVSAQDADTASTVEPTATVTVDQILQSRFERVAGPAAGGAVLDVGAPGSWYDYAVVNPTVDFDGRLYRMWFVGLTYTDDPGAPYGIYGRLGMATSPDGVNWTLANGGKPVRDLGPRGSFDAMAIAHPYVLRVGQQYMLWYGGISGEDAGDLGLKPAHVRVERVGLATSPDGIHWRRANGGRPVMDVGPEGSIDSIQATGMHVLRINGQFVMWYGAYGGLHSFGIATSPDGINWTKGNEGKSLPGFAGKQQLGPSVYFDGAKYFMIYDHGIPGSAGGTVWAAFAATSTDGINWQPAFDDQPLLGPASEDNFGNANGVKGNNHSVHPTQMIVDGNRVRVWYTGEANEALPGAKWAPQRIGLMEATIQ